MRTLPILAATLFLGLCTTAQEVSQSTTVTKNLSSNPTAGLVAFQGDEASRRKLEDVLQRCGWFTLVSGAPAKSAQVRVSAKLEAGSLTLDVTAGNDTFQVAGKGDSAAFDAVDGILRRLFDVQALCSQKIYYVVTGENNLKEIFSCYLDGSGQERVTFNNAISTEPSFGHKNAMVYTLAKNNALAVILSDLANGRQRIVSKESGLNASAGLSRDGALLALPLSMDNQVDIYVTDFRTGERTRITRDKNVESSPCWSPDGKQLVYVSDRLGVPQLYLSDAKPNAKSIRLTPGYREAVSPEWSEVSNKLCFSMKHEGQYVIAVIDMADASHQITVITHAAGNWETPSWAPDGRHIVCTRKSPRDGSSDLYIIDSWQSTFQPISKGANLTLPAWRPAY
ncbi:MAG: PD40 domain-containing protein [Victivallales bacterium]|nr:PD40 domain-containing protein [Victivallales bacterium]